MGAETAVEQPIKEAGSGNQPEPQRQEPTPPPQKTEPPVAPVGDPRAELLSSLGVNSVQDLAQIIRYGEIGYEAAKAKAEEEEAARKKTEEGQIGREYEHRLIQLKDGTKVAPFDVLQEVIRDTKAAAVKEAEDNITRKQEEGIRKVTEEERANQAGRVRFWNKPENKDLLDGSLRDRQGQTIKAQDYVNYLVDRAEWAPKQAALHVREVMYKDNEAREAQEALKQRSQQYEGNWNEEIDETKLDPVTKDVKTRLDKLKEKPEGERGFRSFFKVVKNRWDE